MLTCYIFPRFKRVLNYVVAVYKVVVFEEDKQCCHYFWLSPIVSDRCRIYDGGIVRMFLAATWFTVKFVLSKWSHRNLLVGFIWGRHAVWGIYCWASFRISFTLKRVGKICLHVTEERSVVIKSDEIYFFRCLEWRVTLPSRVKLVRYRSVRKS